MRNLGYYDPSPTASAWQCYTARMSQLHIIRHRCIAEKLCLTLINRLRGMYVREQSNPFAYIQAVKLIERLSWIQVK